MNRRAFVATLAAGTLTSRHEAGAQSARGVARIGILSPSAATAEMIGSEPRSATVTAFLRGLRELGYAYGQHFVTEPRGGESQPERFPIIATELVRLGVDVIVAAGPTLPAVKQATSTIPVVMMGAGDPVAQGLVRSLRQPGGNFTGLSLQSVDTTGKRLALLKEIAPGPAPTAVLWHRPGLTQWQAADQTARAQGWKLLSLEIRDAGDIEPALKAATDAGAGSLLVLAGGPLDRHAARIAELATRSRLPSMYTLRHYVEAGGLVSYSADLIDIYRRGAVFVDKILKGARPASLPIEQPSKFDLVLNLRTAKALGLTISRSLMLRADHVIE